MNQKIPVLLSICSLLTLSGCDLPLIEAVNSKSTGFTVASSAFKVARPDDLKHSFILYPDSLLVRTDSLRTSLVYDSVNAFMLRHQPHLNQQSLSLVLTKEINYKHVVDILDQMAIHQVCRYTLLRYPE
jgi:hypothetical protein